MNQTNTKQTIKCIYCKKSNYIKKGFRKTENRGKIQKYKCLSCNRYFTNDDGFYRMRNSPAKITSALDLYFSSMSSRKVRNFFSRHLVHNASHITILDWCRKYVLKVTKYTEGLKPKLDGKAYADETEIRRGKKHNDIFWCSIDWDTRYIHATHYSPNSQNMKDAIQFMFKIKKSGKPKYVQTDAANFYPNAFNKAFYTRYKQDKVEHRVNNVSKTGKHNVNIETVFSKIKDRVRLFRGLKALWSAPILMQGIILQHNYIEAHTTTNTIPCEKAGLNQITENNRWLEIIKQASNHSVQN